MNLFNSPSVSPLLKNGNRLFGSAVVDCPTCRGRTYIVYIVWGQGGWVYEVEKGGRHPMPVNFLRDRREEFFKLLEAVATENEYSPPQRRRGIFR
jgi:hypothetical protein